MNVKTSVQERQYSYLSSVTVINNHLLGSILTFTLLDLVKQTKVTNTVYAIETKKISVCRYDLFM